MSLMRAALVAIGLVAGTSAAAQDYPTRPITVIVPAAPGGSTDVLARIIAQSMSKTLGQTMVVENVAGAGGTVGMQRGARAQPDGYTLSFGNMGHLAANVPLYPKLGFDPRRDFAPVGVVANVPMVLATSNASGIRTVAQLLDYMRKNEGKLNIGTSGPGSTGHLAPTLLLKQTGFKAQLVTYRGAAPVLNDLLAGVVDAIIDQTVTMIPVHQGKTGVAIAVTSKSRVPQLPDVPTFTEAGLPDFDIVVWNALVAPKNVPQPILAKLAAALETALNDPEVQARFSDLAAAAPAPPQRGPGPLGQLISGDVDRWTSVLAGEAPLN